MFTRSNLRTHIENISLVTGQSALVNAMLEVAVERVTQYYDFPYYLDFKNGFINTVATYETGTITVVNGSTAVVGDSTVWTSAMIGRKIRVQNEKPYYRITAVSSNTALTIDNPYQGTDASAQSYEIFKDEYRLNPDVDKQKIMRQIQNGVAVVDLSPKQFDMVYPAPQSYADPMWSVVVGADTATYTTGTLSGSSTTLTGSGTEWTSVEGLGKGSKIRIGNYVYTVKSVDTALQLTTYDNLPTIAAGTSYEIKLDNIVVQLYQIPNEARILYYRYYRKNAPLLNDYDLPDMPDAFHHILMDGCLSQIWRQKGDITNQTDAENRFIRGLEDMKRKIGSFAPDRINKRKSADGYKQRTAGLEPSSFDRRFSS